MHGEAACRCRAELISKAHPGEAHWALATPAASLSSEFVHVSCLGVTGKAETYV
jgi:hypothetical protein